MIYLGAYIKLTSLNCGIMMLVSLFPHCFQLSYMFYYSLCAPAYTQCTCMISVAFKRRDELDESAMLICIRTFHLQASDKQHDAVCSL